MYGNLHAVLLWLKLLAKYLIKKCNLKISKADSYIFYKKFDDGKLEIVMSVNVDNVFLEGSWRH